MSRSLMSLVALAALTACFESTAPTAPARTIRVSNAFATPVALGIDGTQRIGYVAPGDSQAFAVPATAAVLQYALQPVSAPDGSDAPADAISGTIQLAAGDQRVVIDKRSVGAIFYVGLSNATGAAIDLATVANGAVRCLGTLAAGAKLQYGYFRLTPTTELRYYRGNTGCTGSSYVEWSTAVICTLLTNTGALLLRAVFGVT